MVILFNKNLIRLTNQQKFNKKTVQQQYNIKRFTPKSFSRKPNLNALTPSNRKFLKSLGLQLKS